VTRPKKTNSTTKGTTEDNDFVEYPEWDYTSILETLYSLRRILTTGLACAWLTVRLALQIRSGVLQWLKVTIMLKALVELLTTGHN
jgi:hypothetical protein